jgi:membrane carboxypeptidase/penicillin-binding protein
VATKLTAEPAVDTPLDPALAHLVRETMRSVVTEGSGRRLKRFPRPVAGKTGTSNEARDTWFVALLPDVVTVAWVGFDTPRPLGRKEAGSKTALPLVKHYLEAVEKEGPVWPPAPDGVVLRLIDKASGKLAAPGDEGAVEVSFLEGTEPTEFALAEGELDAGTFVMSQTNGPPLDVPRIGVAEVPRDLRPLGGIAAKPAPEPAPPKVLDDDDLPPNLMPAQPVRAQPADNEDAPD